MGPGSPLPWVIPRRARKCGDRPGTGENVGEGGAELDESMITGEPRPVPRGVGDRVVAGTVSTDSAIRIRAD
ncbi:P-type ATPase [Micromonospora chersina]|uniref:P-type ATPase n=1 Tax=Micromonospora chersina TaxID=47854 RepID=UPI00371377AF